MTRLKKSELFKAISKRFKIPMCELYGLEAMLLDEKQADCKRNIGLFDKAVKAAKEANSNKGDK